MKAVFGVKKEIPVNPGFPCMHTNAGSGVSSPTSVASNPAELSSAVDKNWYNEFYSAQQKGSLAVHPEVVRRYSELRHPRLFYLERWFEILGDVSDKRILYLGCGHDNSGILLAMKGAEVWVLDIASEAVRVQVQMAEASGVGERVHPVVATCEQIPFPDRWFDRVVGCGIWHHLQSDLETPSGEMTRVLAPEGFGVFTEPIAQSPLLSRLRKHVPVAVPASVSPRCYPLTPESMSTLQREFRLEAEFFKCFGRVTRLVLRGTPLEKASAWKRFAVFAVHHMDRALLSLPNTQHLAGEVVLKLSAKEAAGAVA
jgi:ubiquinone/menaquinone biosynthesis C-methylase UbiE